MIRSTSRPSRLMAAALLLMLALQTGLAATHTKQPNILLIFIDDLGFGELGCQGNPEIPTPHIDALAQRGVRFTNGYVTASYCSPSRAGLMTGRYQTRFGYELNPVGKHNLDPDAGLPPSETTLAQQLKSAGYATGLIGKWHLGGTAPHHPLQRGFDEFFGFLHEGHFFVPTPYRDVTSFLRRKTLPGGSGGRWREGNTIWSSHLGRDEPPYDADNPILRANDPVVEHAYLTDALSREAIAFVERHKAEPFFLYLAYNAVHSPMQATSRYMKQFESISDIHRRVFAGMLANLDDGIGAVVGKLQTENLEENTLVFCISDNGGPTAELTSSNLPLRGGKGNLYEGGIRVPFLMQWKGRLPAGRVYTHPVISLDVFATASSVAGAEMPSDRVMDGVDLLPHLTGKRDSLPHETLYWRMRNRTALRHEDWKIVRHTSHGARKQQFELYNLANDLSETTDLALEDPEKLRELMGLWSELNDQMIEPIWSP